MKWTTALKYVLFGLFLLYLVPLLFVRPVADDFCVMDGQRLGLWPYLSRSYQQWTGRVGFIVLHSLIAQFSYVWWSVFMAGLLLFWWFIVYRLLRLFSAAYAASGASLVLVAAFQFYPAPAQSLWWLSGFLTYLFPLMLGSLGVYLCLSWSLSQRSLRQLSARPTPLSPLPSLYWPLFLGLGGALFGFGLVSLAPGNQVRQAYFPRPDLAFALSNSLRWTPLLIAAAVHQAPYALAGLLILPAYARQGKSQPRPALFSLLALIATSWIGEFTAFFATSAPLNGRAPAVVYSIGALCLMAVSYFALPRLPRLWLWLALLLIGGAALSQSVQWTGRLQAYAAAFDKRTAYYPIRPDPYALDTGEAWLRECYAGAVSR